MNDSAYIICRNTKETDAHKAVHALDDEGDRLKAKMADIKGRFQCLKDLCHLFAKRRDEYKARVKELEDMLKPCPSITHALMVEQARIESAQEGRIRK
jgi:hypothetical protein